LVPAISALPDLGKLTLYTNSLSVCSCWSYLHLTRATVLSPGRRAYPPALHRTARQTITGDDDFSGLRYVAGDAMPRIAWKALAREQGLQVKQFSALQGQELWLDWSLLPNIATERKLELLTRWVLDAMHKPALRCAPGSRVLLLWPSTGQMPTSCAVCSKVDNVKPPCSTGSAASCW
jgi:hypothetical protein